VSFWREVEGELITPWTASEILKAYPALLPPLSPLPPPHGRKSTAILSTHLGLSSLFLGCKSVNQRYAHIASCSTHPPFHPTIPRPISSPSSSTLPPLLPWPLSGSPQTSASSPASPWLLLVVGELLVVVASAGPRTTASIPACALAGVVVVVLRPAFPARWPSWMVAALFLLVLCVWACAVGVCD